jgi:hypothetical protein
MSADASIKIFPNQIVIYYPESQIKEEDSEQGSLPDRQAASPAIIYCHPER